MSIEVNNISKLYGAQQVLKSIGFNIDKGEVVGFLGANGAGKTTTMKILTGAIPYSEGSVKICGMEVAENPLEIKKRIGYLPEQNPLYSDMYVKEFLGFVASTYKKEKKKEKIDELIELVGLTKEYKKKIKQLSKGYKQRVGLAQALIKDPEVLILDEPTTGLDPNQLIEIRNLIKEIGKNRTVLFSTHIIQEVEAICNRIIIINRGEIATDLKNSDKLKNNFALEVEFVNPLATEILNALPEIISAKTTNNRYFELMCNLDIREKIFDLALMNNNKILTLKASSQKIENIFRELTQ